MKQRWVGVLVCFISGALTVLGFAPFFWAWLPFFSLAILFYYWLHADTAHQAFLQGFCFGMGLFGAGVSWVYVSLSTYGGMPLWMGGIAVLAFASVLAIFIAFSGYVLVRLFPLKLDFPINLSRLLAIPPLWVIFEWVKSWILTGFPWLEIGYTQTPTWLFALAPIGGIYLISFVLAALACLAVYTLLIHKLFPVLIIFCIWGLVWVLNNQDWSDAVGEPVSIGLVQANVSVNDKWLPNYRNQVIEQFSTLSRQLNQQTPIDLLIWPETALPLYLQQTDEKFWHSILPEKTALLTGLLDNPNKEEVYNAAILLCDGQQQIYRKRHLVPFGEYLPMRFLFNWVLEYLQLPMSDFSAWQGTQPLTCAANINISLSICYEDAFGSEWRKNVGDATMLVNISEDAWFGDSLAPHQRLQMAQMRAREMSRPLVRSANTGPSVVINERGDIVAATAQFEVENMSYRVQPQEGDTLYKRFGNWIIFFSMILLLLILQFIHFSKRTI